MSAPRGAALLSLALALLLAPCAAPAAAEEARLSVRVVSSRGGRVYLSLTTGRGAGEATLEPGQEVVLRGPGGALLRLRLVAVSSKFLVVEGEGELPKGATLTIEGRLGARPAPTEGPPPGPPRGGGDAPRAPVVLGRRAPTLEEFQRAPLPDPEPVPFRGKAPLADAPGPNRRPADGKAGQPGAGPWVDAEGRERTATGRLANQLKGELAVGVDGVYDDQLRVSRTTPFARLRLELRQLGGSDRVSFSFLGSVRHPFNGERDWTGHDSEQVQARLTHVVFEVEAERPEAIRELSDRLELAVGRSVVPRVTEAGLVDGARLGLRVGPLVPFVFGGVAVAGNPRREDYDSFIYGGGARLELDFGHGAALRLSLAGAQERYREKGERDFVEAQGEVRVGAFGARGALVVDFFDALEDRKDVSLTTGELLVYAQVTREVRVEAGYRERRPVYQRALFQEDLDPLAIPFLPRDARRDLWAEVRLKLPEGLEVLLRGEHFQGDDARDATGGHLGLAWQVERRHRVGLDLAARHRLKGAGNLRHSTDPYARLHYTYTGERLVLSLALAFRDSLPLVVHDRRVGLRAQADYDLGAGFGLQGWGQVDFRRGPFGEDGTTSLVGLAARYRF